MGSSLRHTKSEENLTGEEQVAETNTTNVEPQTRQTVDVNGVAPQTTVNAAFNSPEDDPNDCWSQEDEEISEQVNVANFSASSLIYLFIYLSTVLSTLSVFTIAETSRQRHDITAESRVVR